jgi:branched-chain amino acid transport system permease protein
MDTKFILLILNGLTQASILFVLGSGLTLAFGLMRVVNLSHGAFYLLGGYIGYSIVKATGNWPLALLAGGLSIALLGFLFERMMLSRVRGGDLPETLLTVALSMIIADQALVYWAKSPLTLNVPFVPESSDKASGSDLPWIPLHHDGGQHYDRRFPLADPL